MTPSIAVRLLPRYCCVRHDGVSRRFSIRARARRLIDKNTRRLFQTPEKGTTGTACVTAFPAIAGAASRPVRPGGDGRLIDAVRDCKTAGGHTGIPHSSSIIRLIDPLPSPPSPALTDHNADRGWINAHYVYNSFVLFLPHQSAGRQAAAAAAFLCECVSVSCVLWHVL